MCVCVGFLCREQYKPEGRTSGQYLSIKIQTLGSLSGEISLHYFLMTELAVGHSLQVIYNN